MPAKASASSKSRRRARIDGHGPDARLIDLGIAFDLAAAEADRLDDQLQSISDRAWASVAPGADLTARKSDKALLTVYALATPPTGVYTIAEISLFRSGRPFLSDEMRERKRAVVAAWDQWVAAVAKATAEAGGAEIKPRAKDQNARARDLAAQIMLLPARTLAGAIVKARIARWARGAEAEYLTGEYSDDNVVDSLIADLLTMAQPSPADPSPTVAAS